MGIKTRAVQPYPRRPMANGEYVFDMSENRFLPSAPTRLGGSRKKARQ
jgi:hypothetical protein